MLSIPAVIYVTMHNFWFVLLVGGLCMAFCAFVEAKSNYTEEIHNFMNVYPCSDPCIERCNYTRTDARLKVICQRVKCRCIPDGIPREVTSLIFTGNVLTYLRAGTFQNLTELDELILRANKIEF